LLNSSKIQTFKKFKALFISKSALISSRDSGSRLSLGAIGTRAYLPDGCLRVHSIFIIENFVVAQQCFCYSAGDETSCSADEHVLSEWGTVFCQTLRITKTGTCRVTIRVESRKQKPRFRTMTLKVVK